MSNSWYDTMLVCENGHKITDLFDSYPDHFVERCSGCGAKTISQCPHCQEKIRGYHHIPGVVGIFDAPPPPQFCHKCGNPYPWQGKQDSEVMQKSPGQIEIIKNICNTFFLVARQLQNRYDNRTTLEVNDEYDVQDLMHALMFIFFDDIRSEEWTPSYAGGSSRMDFLLKREQFVLEVKRTRKGLGSKEIGDQLIIDIDRYKEHPDCKTLICFVYDPEGRIGNPNGLERDLSGNNNGMNVIVIIRPKGR